MAGANSNIQFADLDFADIKTSLTEFLKSQDTFKDYNFSGSGLSVLLDILAYNTQYNAYYLNMVGNEMFLDTALQRGSVVSQAKLLNYTPKSALAPTATVNITVNEVTTPSLTLPKNTRFLSEAVNEVNYTFVSADSKTVNVNAGTAVFNDVVIRQGEPLNYSFTVNNTINPSQLFEIPDQNIDTTSLVVSVQQSGANTSKEVYSLSSDYLELNSESRVYFLQEGLNGNFEIYFGDGIIGKRLVDGNIVRINYISTEGSAATGANNFVLLDSISGFSNTIITSVYSASKGGEKEPISSIKFQAPKTYSAQGRAVSKEDYITLIQQNNLGFSFDAVNVWGGQENDPPVYGQVFISLKPQGAYNLTDVQKQRIINEVIKPISVMTVTPTIVDPDYTYIQIIANVLYDPKKTTLTSNQLADTIKTAIQSFADKTLNTFNSTFVSNNLLNTIQSVDRSVIASDLQLNVQKKIFPILSSPTAYKLYFGTPLNRGMFQSGVTSSPSVMIYDPANPASTIDGVYIEEVPSSSGGIDSISILNPGHSYQVAPIVKIIGDGIEAKAVAQIDSVGRLKSVTITNVGAGYTSAIATITPAPQDTTGAGAYVVVNLSGRYGSLRSYYNNSSQAKTIVNYNEGIVDYVDGVVSLNSFAPIKVNNDLGQFIITASPTSQILSSSYNRIVTVDPFDPTSIIVNVTAKT